MHQLLYIHEYELCKHFEHHNSDAVLVIRTNWIAYVIQIQLNSINPWNLKWISNLSCLSFHFMMRRLITNTDSIPFDIVPNLSYVQVYVFSQLLPHKLISRSACNTLKHISILICMWYIHDDGLPVSSIYVRSWTHILCRREDRQTSSLQSSSMKEHNKYTQSIVSRRQTRLFFDYKTYAELSKIKFYDNLAALILIRHIPATRIECTIWLFICTMAFRNRNVKLQCL